MSTRPPSPFAIYGERRIGKSSIFKQLLNRQQQSRFRCNPRGLRLVYVDFTLNLPRTDAAFIEALHEALCRQLQHDPATSDSERLQASIHRDRLNRSANSELPIVWDTFRRHLESLAVDDRYVVFFLDEAEVAFREANVSTHILSQLRALVTDGQCNVSFFVSTVNPLAEIGDAFVSSLFHQIFIAHVPIGHLDEAAAVALMTTLSTEAGVTFGTEDQALILEIAGPHPFLLQIAAYYVFDGYLDALGRQDRLPRGAALPAINHDDVEERYEAYVWQNYFQTVWRHLPERDRVAFHNLATQGTMLQNQLAPEQLAGLLRQGYLIRNGTSVQLFSRSMAEFVLGQELTSVAELRRREGNDLRRDVWGLIEELEKALRELIDTTLAANFAGDAEAFLLSKYPDLYSRWSKLQERDSFQDGTQESYLGTIFDYSYLGVAHCAIAGGIYLLWTGVWHRPHSQTKATGTATGRDSRTQRSGAFSRVARFGPEAR